MITICSGCRKNRFCSWYRELRRRNARRTTNLMRSNSFGLKETFMASRVILRRVSPRSAESLGAVRAGSNLVTEFIDSDSGAVLKSFSIPARSQPRSSSCLHCESPFLKQEDLAGVIKASLSPRMPNMNVSIYIVIAIVVSYPSGERKQ